MNALTAIGLNHFKNIFLDSSSESDLEGNEDVISKLKFISYIQKDEKIDVKHLSRQPNTVMTKINRMFIFPDNRNKCHSFVRDVINRSFQILESYYMHDNILACKNLICDLINAKQGLANLKYTYSDDTLFCCNIDILIEKIDGKLSKIREKEPILFGANIGENLKISDTKAD